MSCRAVVVDLPFLKPCWWFASGSASCRGCSIIASRVLAGGESSEIGRWLDPSSAGLLGFNKGIILAVFQIVGMMA